MPEQNIHEMNLIFGMRDQIRRIGKEEEGQPAY